MKTIKCTCTFYKLKARGFKPVTHAHTCPMFNRVNSPYKEEWVSKNDKIKYEGQNKENLKIGSEKARETRRRTDTNKV